MMVFKGGDRGDDMRTWPQAGFEPGSSAWKLSPYRLHGPALPGELYGGPFIKEFDGNPREDSIAVVNTGCYKCMNQNFSAGLRQEWAESGYVSYVKE